VLIADVAVPVPLGHPFSYEVPAELRDKVGPGKRVLCAFGPRTALGVVLEVSEREIDFDPKKLRPIAAVIDDEPVLPAELLVFLRELAAYYLAPIGEVLRMALPLLERKQVSAIRGMGAKVATRAVASRRETFARRREERREGDGAKVEPGANVEPEGGGVKVGRRGAEVLAYLAANGETSVAELERNGKGARGAVRRLATAGLVDLEEREVSAEPFFAAPVPLEPAPVLTDAQAIAAKALSGVIASGERKSFLLRGVTGSGKTEVYLRAIQACLEAGKGALVLVPEIALTPQLVARFRARFGDGLAVIHSGLGDSQRHVMWRSLRSGAAQVAIGARSALFAPVQRLGLIVVDEEHDGSFKQEEGARYHARDMALLRAHRAGAVAVLGSATPSLETEMLVRTGKLNLLELPERAHATAVLPTIELVDLRVKGAGPTRNPLVSLPLHRELQRVLAAGEQAILFLNRRGFAPSILCDSCGTIMRCKLCSVALTFHRASRGRLLCHYCDFICPLPESCDECGKGPLLLEGVGTEKLEAVIAEGFPGARVARLDRDVAAGAAAEQVLDRVRRGDIDVLVGTQMVAKGHDLPRVTLVGVINADASLSMPDHRASERAFQLLVQVAGRAGRHDRPGKVLIQTRNPENPAIVFATKHDVRGFVEHALAERRELEYPPFGYLALVRVDSPDEQRVERVAAEIAKSALQASKARGSLVVVRGPAPAPIARLRGRFRYHILLRATERKSLRAVLHTLVPFRDRAGAQVRIAIDVDPVQMM
jgi:primosomal protein N' (replication factor Y)